MAQAISSIVLNINYLGVALTMAPPLAYTSARGSALPVRAARPMGPPHGRRHAPESGIIELIFTTGILP